MNTTSIPEISVIIPIYNSSEYIGNCLDSLIKQTFENFEVITVNNQSADNSEEMLKGYCEKDGRFFCYNSSEGKTGTTRNIGIDNARGKYLAFVDVDDVLMPDYLEKMYTAAKESGADIVVSGFSYNFTGKGGRVRRSSRLKDKEEYSSEEAMHILLKDHPMRFFLWNKLWKKELFVNNNIVIPDMYYEDAVTCPKLFYYAKQIMTIDCSGYLYTRPRTRYKEQCMSSERINDYINTVPLMRQFLEEKDCYSQHKGCFMHHVMHVYLSLPGLLMQARGETQDGFLKNLTRSYRKLGNCLKVPAEELNNIDTETPSVR